MTIKKLLQELKKFNLIKSCFYQFEINLKNAKLFFSLRDDVIFTRVENLTEAGQKIVKDFEGNLNTGKNNFFSFLYLGSKKEKIETNNDIFFKYLNKLNE
jgi:hypothetical protein